ncbi:GMP synthase [Salinigranum rubrum]|uniref:GMP synthase n=1 Tax=Salinigranum rubrum TaxID=755307 RepID=A0A2I8VFH3_9EURY|nr:type 1 glutamine amidotransferase [Salinigranum rubrum]AUV80614.1 GMP synthase [Salinigranum rubrum]
MLLVCDTEVDPDAYGYLPQALRALLPDHEHSHYPSGERPSLDGVDAVVVTGSTAGVYEADDRPWIRDAKRFVRRTVDREIPLLGVCFGHQLVNDALGGRVEHRGLTARLVDADIADDPLFAGVEPTFPMVHGDHVTDLGEGMEAIASADYYPLLASRHVDAPVWTTQYHPEFTGDFLSRIERDFGWEGARDFGDVTATRTVENFLRLAGVDSDD